VWSGQSTNAWANVLYPGGERPRCQCTLQNDTDALSLKQQGLWVRKEWSGLEQDQTLEVFAFAKLPWGGCRSSPCGAGD